MQQLIVPGLVGLTVVSILMIFAGLRRMAVRRESSISNRLAAFGARNAPTVLPKQNGGSGLQIAGMVDRAVSRQTFAQRLARDLARADLKITVGEYLVAVAVLVCLSILLGMVTRNVVIGLALVCAAIAVPRLIVSQRRSNRLRDFNAQLADTITLLANSLRSGYSLLQAMELVSRESRAPMSTEFERVVREVGLGLAPEEALANLVRRIQSDDLELMVTAINVQREVGGNLAEILDTISTTIRERVKLKGEIRVLTSQQQYSGYIIAAMPIALALVLFAINPNYMTRLFTETHWCGLCLVGTSISMILAGFFIIMRIVNIEV
ncbi:MAG TPA: type II secretion system F family protein [Ktedonobacterales bacterium]|nr:type II secretion system F family protein [Ktedonobacterales bacterium]